ncbi:hypothetical protein [Salicibibacter kimchii]|uniref:LPXTG cell wall anchor domain-containing protein n=1 Tax=Salicibibacter kimchii TaxID=2099786 RepID=A0A345C0Z8_9BACI|nr:hypothetical protein [Salicibibacter kimchii]AXF56879.1 hypothetical protein DT065_13290 [Salicibibacter kimchii]
MKANFIWTLNPEIFIRKKTVNGNISVNLTDHKALLDTPENGNGSDDNGDNGSENGDNGVSSYEEGGSLPDTDGSTPLIILIGSLMVIGGGAFCLEEN